MLAGRYVVVSNNSTETPDTMAGKLREVGVPVDPERIILAGTLMIDELLAEPDAPPVALYAAPELAAYAEQRGLRLLERHRHGDTARVAIARDTTLVYDDLNRALDHLARGADLTVSNPDLTHPGVDQVPVVETGALLAVFRACLPHLKPRIIGKPEPLMFEAALRRFGTTPERAVMVGDNPQTDGAGASRVGMPSILVGPLGHHASIGDLIAGG
jgi:HAD superfamily hydrolase (TIGR01450 family)